MAIIHQQVKIGGAKFYVPETHNYDGRPLSRPRFTVWFSEDDNPGRDKLPWRISPRDGKRKGHYASTVPPRLTLIDQKYPELVHLHDQFRVRNLPMDFLFVGATVDIVVTEYPKAEETILQFSELIVRRLDELNTNADYDDE